MTQLGIVPRAELENDGSNFWRNFLGNMIGGVAGHLKSVVLQRMALNEDVPDCLHSVGAVLREEAHTCLVPAPVVAKSFSPISS